MKAIDEIIGDHQFFAGMQPDHLQFIAGCASNVTVNAGDFVFREGESADRFFIVRHGVVAIELHDARRGDIRIHTVNENDVLGWSWLFPPYRWHYGARALTLVRMTAFDGQCLREKCDSDHSLGYDLMKRFAVIMMERLQATRMQVLDVYG
jgi:CRP/FNR family transcriptional regulator, cyclic AMP receptor protein